MKTLFRPVGWLLAVMLGVLAFLTGSLWAGVARPVGRGIKSAGSGVAAGMEDVMNPKTAPKPIRRQGPASGVRSVGPKDRAKVARERLKWMENGR